MTTKQKILVSICAALLAVLSQVSIPLPFTTVPATLQIVTITIISITLGPKLSPISVCVYILLGVIGIPVFSGFSSGISAILGPTGGYIIGFIFMSFLVGYSSTLKHKKLSYFYCFLGLLADYILGTIQLKYSLSLTWYQSILSGVLPFIIKDIVLTTLSIPIGLKIKSLLKSNSILI